MSKVLKFIKSALLWAVLIFSGQVFCQSGYILYSNEAEYSPYFQKMKKNNFSEFKKVEHFADYEKRIMGQIDYILKFTKNKSTFRPITDKAEDSLVLNTKLTEGIYYKDLRSNFININRRSKDYVVRLALIKWEITNESKQILGYTCYKANGKKIYNDSIALNTKIEAWFTKDILVPHGPKGINGLPGLILEAHHLSYHLYAEEINLNTKEVITIPNRGEKIEEVDYYKLMQSPIKH